MIYRQQDLKQKMAEVAPTIPTTASQVKAARNHMLDARDQVRDIEQQLYYARQDERETLLNRLQAAKERALDAQKEFERIGPYGPALEAQERDRIAAAEQERQREQDQLANAAMQEAEAKESTRQHYLAAGGTPAQFEKSWPSLWAAELERRTIAGTDALRQRMLASGKYS